MCARARVRFCVRPCARERACQCFSGFFTSNRINISNNNPFLFGNKVVGLLLLYLWTSRDVSSISYECFLYNKEKTSCSKTWLQHHERCQRRRLRLAGQLHVRLLRHPGQAVHAPVRIANAPKMSKCILCWCQRGSLKNTAAMLALRAGSSMATIRAKSLPTSLFFFFLLLLGLPPTCLKIRQSSWGSRTRSAP